MIRFLLAFVALVLTTTTLFATDKDTAKDACILLLKNNFIDCFSIKELNKFQHVEPVAGDALVNKLLYFKDHYDNESQPRENRGNDHPAKIPSIIHLVWVGPKPFPDLAIFDYWHEKNPQYRIILWTDRKRPINCPFLELRDITTLFPLQLQHEFEAASNAAEQSDILRLEILERFGGVYADVDVLCYRSFDSLNCNFSFFCGIESISPFTKNTVFKVSNALVGATPHHRIIQHTMDRIHENWEESTHAIYKSLVGMPPYSMYNLSLSTNLVFWRTFLPFTETVLATDLVGDEAVFPHYYFGLSNYKEAKYALHLFSGTWGDHESEKNTRENQFTQRHFKTITKLYRNTILIAVFSLVTLIFSITALCMVVKKKKNKQMI